MNASEIYKIRWLPCENAFNQAIPPFSLVIPVELDSSGNFTVSQPNVDSLVCAVTNGFQIAPTDPKAPGHGAMTFDFPSWVAYDNTNGDPNIGDTWGAAKNSWLLTKGKTGFVVVGVDKTNVRAMVVPANGSSGNQAGGNNALIRINAPGTPQADSTFDGTLMTVGPQGLGLTAAGSVWFYDPNKPALLPVAVNAFNQNFYMTGFLVPGGNYNGRPLYCRDDFDLSVEDTRTGVQTNQVRRLQFDSTGSNVSDDWHITLGDDGRSLKIDTNGVTNTLFYYRYQCVNGNLTEFRATAVYEHGLLKQWTDYQ